MDADLEYLDEAWNAWQEKLLLAAHTERALEAARYWLDVVLIGGLANP